MSDNFRLGSSLYSEKFLFFFSEKFLFNLGVDKVYREIKAAQYGL